ncbi:MAG TPA: VOC family protein, partial [Chloroflexia bacterium]|nr:VOC family protein [Chloroflexia bacterium]
VQGLHHITIVCANAQRTVDFYTGVLGLRLVKKTVNFDDPGSYHLYFGDEMGTPGSAITYFEWPGAPKGHWGIGGTHHYALQVADYDGLLKWKRRLNDFGLPVDGPLDRHYFTSIYFNDPDGTILEIATIGPGWTLDEEPDRIGTEYREPPPEMLVRNRDEARIAATTWPEPVPMITPDMALRHGMHHITAISSDIERTHDFFSGLLGMRRVKMTSNFDDPDSAHWYWGVGDGRPGTLITYFGRSAAQERRMRMGAGQTHHFALAVPGEDTQLEWRERLIKAGVRVTQVLDRVYFKSIYMNDPDGHIVELATLGPGFAVDEDPALLGTLLKLPPWLERDRERIGRNLRPITAPEWAVQEA